MRNNPPYAPFVNVQNRAFVSRSLGCYLDHPVYGFDIAAVSTSNDAALGDAGDARDRDGRARRSAPREPGCGVTEGRHAAFRGRRRRSVDPALGYLTDTWMLEYATCAKLFNHADEPGAAGTRPVTEVVDRYVISKDGRTYNFALKETFRFHTGAR